MVHHQMSCEHIEPVTLSGCMLHRIARLGLENSSTSTFKHVKLIVQVRISLSVLSVSASLLSLPMMRPKGHLSYLSVTNTLQRGYGRWPQR